MDRDGAKFHMQQKTTPAPAGHEEKRSRQKEGHRGGRRHLGLEGETVDVLDLRG